MMVCCRAKTSVAAFLGSWVRTAFSVSGGTWAWPQRRGKGGSPGEGPVPTRPARLLPGCVSTAGAVDREENYFFRGKIFMTENSAKNMRILIMVLRDACTESLDIPKYRLHSIFPKRQIANTKDEQSWGEKSYIFLMGCLASFHYNREKRDLYSLLK